MKLKHCILFLVFYATASKGQIRRLCSLPDMPEISGLMLCQNRLWAINDGQNPPFLHCIDTVLGKPTDTTSFLNAVNTDWEELCHNDSQVFIGDFGNNNGTRRDLKIYRFAAADLGNRDVHCDTISFYYPTQTQYAGNPLTLYDCEAMLAFDDSIYLFSKSIGDGICRQYAIPNAPGTHAARLVDSLNPEFWVTGICRYLNMIYVTGYGYNGELTPQMKQYIFENRRILQPEIHHAKFKYSGPFQIESCAAISIHQILIAAEESNGYDAGIMTYNNSGNLNISHYRGRIQMSPNPAKNSLWVKLPKGHSGGNATVYDSNGRQIINIRFRTSELQIPLQGLPPGNYYCRFRSPHFLDARPFIIEQ